MGLLAAGEASAITINFDLLAATDLPLVAGDVVPAPGSVLTNQYGLGSFGVVFGQAGQSAGVAVARELVDNSLAPSSPQNSVVGLDAGGVIPGGGSGLAMGDIYFHFVDPLTGGSGITDQVNFTLGDAGFDNDLFNIRAFDLVGATIYDQPHSGVSRFTVALNLPGIHSLEIDFLGNFGYSLDDLTFNDPVLPEPSTLLLLAAALGVLAAARRSART